MAMLSRPRRWNWQPRGSGWLTCLRPCALYWTRLVSRHLRPARFAEVSRDVTTAPLPMPPLDRHTLVGLATITVASVAYRRWRAFPPSLSLAKFLHCTAPPSWCASRTSVLQECETRPDCQPDWPGV